MKISKRFFSELCLLLSSCVFALYGAEGILRCLYVRPNPLANYYPLQAAKLGKTIQVQQHEYNAEYRYNSQGFRGPEIALEKRRGIVRILFVGDSFTEGFGVDVSRRYSERLIDKLGPGYEGVNVAQLATNPDTYLDNIAKFGIALRPDAIVMGVFLGNDFMGGRGIPAASSYKVNPSFPNVKTSSLLDASGLGHLHAMWRQLRKGEVMLMRRRNLEAKNYWELYFNQAISKEYFAHNFKLTVGQLDRLTSGFNQTILQEVYRGRVHPGMFGEAVNNQLKIKEQVPYYIDADYRNTYADIKEASRIVAAHGIRFLVLIIPDINQVHPVEYGEVFREDFLVKKLPVRLDQLKEFHVRLRRDLAHDRIAYVDPTDALRNAGELTYFLYDSHMNARGHEIVSGLLLPTVKRMLAAGTAR